MAGRRLAGLLALAFGPLAAWSVFATIWYGFPLPNTAYAKLDTGISAFVLVRQGVRYVLHTAGWDALVVAGLGGFVWWARRERGEWPWLVAVLLQLAYVVRVGGDFMQGRFLAGIFLVAAAPVHLGHEELLESLELEAAGASAVVQLRVGEGTVIHPFAVIGGDPQHNGYKGEPVRLERDTRQRTAALWLGGNRLAPEAVARRELARRYGTARS